MNSKSSRLRCLYRAGFSCAAASLLVSVSAQTTPPKADEADPKEAPLILSKFVVTSTLDKGYTSTNAATGFKTNEDLMNIPQAVTIVTRDLINDLGAVDSSNILRYAGVGNFFAGESFALRGTRINYPLLDEMPDGAPYADNLNLDSYTVLRGPAATLYVNAALGGTVLTNSKFPESNSRYSLTAKITDYGTYRLETDVTGPIGSIGDAHFSYRLVAGLQKGDSYFKRIVDHRELFHPTLQMSWKNTVVRVAYDQQFINHVSGGNSFITPTGELFTGAGRDEGFYANNGLEDFKRQGIRAFVIQKLADNWDMKLAYSNWWFSRYGSIIFGAGGVNWPAQTITLTSRKNDQKIDDNTVVLDVNGKYHLGKIPLQSTFGLTYEHNHGISRILSWVPGVYNPITVPIARPGLENISAPDPSNATGGLPTGTNTYKANFYYQQTANIIPDRLILVAGITSAKIKTNNIANLFTGAMGVPAQGKENLHRYGVVFNITKDIAAYAMESTTFTPTSNRDINLNILPVQAGKAQELGIKTALFGGRLSSTLAVFKIELSNQSYNAGVRPDGISYFAPIGSTTQEGFDIDFAYSPIPGLQFVGAYYSGRVRAYRDDISYNSGVDGDNVPNSYGGQYSLVGRYDFQSGKLKGLTVGSGFTSLLARKLAPGVYVGAPTPVPMGTLKSTGATINNTAVIKVETSYELSFFASYKLNRNWLFRVNVDNALDEAYVLGGQGALFIDPSLPRSFSFSSTYRF